jgi:hypothetical protein
MLRSEAKTRSPVAISRAEYMLRQSARVGYSSFLASFSRSFYRKDEVLADNARTLFTRPDLEHYTMRRDLFISHRETNRFRRISAINDLRMYTVRMIQVSMVQATDRPID